MWLPLALTTGFALVFLALFREERRIIAREATAREAAERQGEGWGVRQVPDPSDVPPHPPGSSVGELL